MLSYHPDIKRYLTDYSHITARVII